MSTTDPIRNPEDIKKMLYYYKAKNQLRNCSLISMGLHSALRISDLLRLKWKNLYDFEQDRFKEHIYLVEGKTKKNKQIALSDELLKILSIYKDSIKEISHDTYIFKSQKGYNRPICREQAYKLIRKAADELGLEGVIGCHSLRKTFGNQAWKQGIQPALIMDIYNHSSFSITKKYLCIDQEDKDEVYKKIKFSCES